MKEIFRISSLSLIFLLLLGGCTTVPETGRSSLQLLPDSQLASLSVSSFQQMKQQIRVSRNRSVNAQVNRVGKAIIESARERGAELAPYEQWEFVVFEDPSANAFAMPGGKVGVHTGILDLMESDDELAVVIGHEVAHVAAGHGNERMSRQMIITGVGVGLGFALDNEDDKTRALLLSAYGAGAQVGINLPFSRREESEADEIGLIWSANAGYDPRAAIPFWRKMEDTGGVRPPEFLSTHPSGNTRIRELTAIMPRALEIYRFKQSEQAQLGPVNWNLLLAEAH